MDIECSHFTSYQSRNTHFIIFILLVIIIFTPETQGIVCYHYERVKCDQAKAETKHWQNDPRCNMSVQMECSSSAKFCYGLMTMNSKVPPFDGRTVVSLITIEYS